MEGPYLNDYAKNANERGLEAVRLMKLNPYTIEQCFEQRDKFNKKIEAYYKTEAIKKAAEEARKLQNPFYKMVDYLNKYHCN